MKNLGGNPQEQEDAFEIVKSVIKQCFVVYNF